MNEKISGHWIVCWPVWIKRNCYVPFGILSIVLFIILLLVFCLFVVGFFVIHFFHNFFFCIAHFGFCLDGYVFTLYQSVRPFSSDVHSTLRLLQKRWTLFSILYLYTEKIPSTQSSFFFLKNLINFCSQKKKTEK